MTEFEEQMAAMEESYESLKEFHEYERQGEQEAEQHWIND